MADERGEALPDVAGLRLAITGASGFVGRRLIASLAERGARVTAILRSGHEAGWLKAQGADAAVVALTDGPGLTAALAGAEVLVHLAYDVRAGGEKNLRAFVALMAAGQRAGIGRVVHVSSAVVYADWPERRIDEASALTGAPVATYRGAKAAMEKWLENGPFPAAILQPTIVYGPGSALWTDAPLAAMGRGGVVLPEPVGLCPALHVDDLVQAILRAATVPDLGRERFLISGADRMTWAEFFEGYRAVAGMGEVILRPLAELQARLGPVGTAASGGPSVAARFSAVARRVIGSRRFSALVAAASRRRGGTGPTWPDRSALALYAGRVEVSTDRAEARLGYRARVTFAEELERIRTQFR